MGVVLDGGRSDFFTKCEWRTYYRNDPIKYDLDELVTTFWLYIQKDFLALQAALFVVAHVVWGLARGGREN